MNASSYGNLPNGGAPSDGVSRRSRGNSELNSLWVEPLRGHCVSRPVMEHSARFLNCHSDFEPHCVSRDSPVESPQRIGRNLGRLGLGPLQPPAQPVLAVVVGVTPPPPAARLPVPLGLAGGTAAGALAVASARVRREPLPTDPTRTLASHAVLRQDSLPPLPAWLGRTSVNADRRPVTSIQGGSLLTSRGGSILASAEVHGFHQRPRIPWACVENA
jgi:hypothetical protein